MFNSVNIYEELLKEKASSEELLLREANQVLKKEDLFEEGILNRIYAPPDLSLKEGSYSCSSKKNIFTTEQVRSVCIKYRLRFLDSHLFKGEIPYEAILKIKQIEKEHDVKLYGFKILAPASLFRLEDRNKDPLLFAKILDGQYLLIHKWGNDINWFRKVLSFPLSTVKTFIFTLLVLSLLITLAVPVGYSTRMFIFLLSNLFFLVVFTYVGYLRFNQDFSENEWDSKFVN